MHPQRAIRSLSVNLSGGALLATTVAMAANAPPLSELDLRVTESDIQPQVRVKDFDNRRVEEYSVNNNVYMVKITPNAGAPYYLLDQDGSGDMEWNRGQPGRDIQVPQWTLFSW
jgi:hypothetical protein